MRYALITGASKGIGRAIAFELANDGYHLLLVSRSENLLKAVAKEITDQTKVQVHFLTTDLSSPIAPHQVFDWCIANNYTVQCLVNNAGYGLSGAFEKYSLEENLNMMHVNMNSPVQLCQLFLPMLKEQKKSYILNVASSAAYQAVPGLCVYAATKVFMLHFGRALREELRNSSVSVTSVCPGPTDTDFPTRAQVGMKASRAAKKVNMTPQEVARIAIDGLFRHKAEVVPGIINKLNVFAAWLLPKILLERIALKIYQD